MPAWCDRKAIVFPGLEPADHVTGSVEAKLDEVASGENRRVTMVANEDQPLVEAAEVEVAPRAIQRNPPLEHRPRDVQAPGDDALKLAGVLRADVDDDPVGRGGREGLSSIEPRLTQQPRTRKSADRPAPGNTAITDPITATAPRAPRSYVALM